MLRSVDPSTGLLLHEYSDAGPAQIAAALEAAAAAFRGWSRSPLAERAQRLPGRAHSSGTGPRPWPF